MRRAIAALSAVALLGLSCSAPTQASSFYDTYGHWARAEIASGVADRYINGFPDGSFRPDQSITRAEFFALLTGALQMARRPGDAAPYAPAHWAVNQGQLQAAVAGGLLNPPDYANWILPDQPITRREIVLAAVRAIGREGQIGQLWLNSADAATYPQWLRDWAAVAVNGGILQGYENGSLGLERTATRAEALVMVQRILAQVSVQVAPSDVAASPDLLRHPEAGAATWTVDRADADRPAFSDGVHPYHLDANLSAYRLMPAPDGAAWLVALYGSGDRTSSVLWRLAGGSTAEVGRYGAPLVPLELDGAGRLWLGLGTDLLVAGADGKVRTVSVGEPLLYGDLDAAGNLWAIGQGDLYRISPAGAVERVQIDLAEQARVRHLAVAPDSSVWLMLEGLGSGPRVEAVRLRGGKVVQRTPVITRAFGGAGAEVEAAVLSGEGAVRLLVALAPEPALFRFDLATGISARVVAPPSVGRGARVLPAPDGGALLQDAEGDFWRVLP